MAKQYDIPTIVTTCLAVAMSICYIIVPEAGKTIFLVFTAISWFIVAVCWLALKSTQYMHNMGGHEEEKKKLATSHGQQTVQLSSSELNHAKQELSADLGSLQSSLQDKDAEIGKLKAEIASLNTMVEIEKLRAEIANLKALAAKEASRKK
ncbi:MAG: hypothetical protein KGI33_09910 [Thaumarchaeota archaeon]|nr:hypothetical protein [Nitrososphaerota archaeon]